MPRLPLILFACLTFVTVAWADKWAAQPAGPNLPLGAEPPLAFRGGLAMVSTASFEVRLDNGHRESYPVKINQGFEHVTGPIAVTPRGRYILAVHGYEQELDESDTIPDAEPESFFILDRRTRKIRSWSWQPRNKRDYFLGAAFSRDTKRIYIASTAALQTFDLASLRQMQYNRWSVNTNPKKHSLTTFSPAADKFYFLSIEQKRVVHTAWDMSGHQLSQLIVPLQRTTEFGASNGVPCGVYYAEGGRSLFIEDVLDRNRKLFTRVVDTSTGKTRWRHQTWGFKGLVDSGKLALWATARHIIVYEISTGRRLRVLPRTSRADNEFASTSDGRWLLTNGYSGDIANKQRLR